MASPKSVADLGDQRRALMMTSLMRVTSGESEFDSMTIFTFWYFTFAYPSSTVTESVVAVLIIDNNGKHTTRALQIRIQRAKTKSKVQAMNQEKGLR